MTRDAGERILEQFRLSRRSDVHIVSASARGILRDPFTRATAIQLGDLFRARRTPAASEAFD